MKYTLNISFICSFVFSIIHLSLNNKLQIMKYCAQTWLRDPLLGSVLQQVFHYSALTLNVPMLETQSNQLYKQPAKQTPALPLQTLHRQFCLNQYISYLRNAQIRPTNPENLNSWILKEPESSKEGGTPLSLSCVHTWNMIADYAGPGHRCMLYDVSTQPITVATLYIAEPRIKIKWRNEEYLEYRNESQYCVFDVYNTFGAIWQKHHFNTLRS